jgi:hypothetical protein
LLLVKAGTKSMTPLTRGKARTDACAQFHAQCNEGQPKLRVRRSQQRPSARGAVLMKVKPAATFGFQMCGSKWHRCQNHAHPCGSRGSLSVADSREEYLLGRGSKQKNPESKRSGFDHKSRRPDRS